MKVLKTATWRIKPRRMQHLILTLHSSPFRLPLEIWFFPASPIQLKYRSALRLFCEPKLQSHATLSYPAAFQSLPNPLQGWDDPPCSWIHHHYKMRAAAEEASGYAILSVPTTYMQLIGLFPQFFSLFHLFFSPSAIMSSDFAVSSSPCWFMSSRRHVHSQHYIQSLLWDSCDLHEYPPSDLFYTEALISLHVCLESICSCCDGLIILPKIWATSPVCFQTTIRSLAYKRLVLIFLSSLRCFSP